MVPCTPSGEIIKAGSVAAAGGEAASASSDPSGGEGGSGGSGGSGSGGSGGEQSGGQDEGEGALKVSIVSPDGGDLDESDGGGNNEGLYNGAEVELWLPILDNLSQMCRDPRFEVTEASLAALRRILINGDEGRCQFSAQAWILCFDQVRQLPCLWSPFVLFFPFNFWFFPTYCLAFSATAFSHTTSFSFPIFCVFCHCPVLFDLLNNINNRSFSPYSLTFSSHSHLSLTLQTQAAWTACD